MTRHCHHYGCLWLLALLGWTVVLGVLLAAWLAWAAVIVPSAGIVLATGNRRAAGRLVHTLKWNLWALVGR